MKVGPLEIAAIIAIHVLLAVALFGVEWQHAKEEISPQYVAVEGALLCRSPDVLRFSDMDVSPLVPLVCDELPAGTRVRRLPDQSNSDSTRLKLHLVDEGDRIPRGWGLRHHFTLPNGTAIVDGPHV